MSVIVNNSVCVDCDGRTTCMRLKRLNPGTTIRDEMKELYQGVDTGTVSGALLYVRHGRKKEVFDVVIVNCSMKEKYSMRKKMGSSSVDDKDNTLYYCPLCKSMHRNSSEIGLAHKSKKSEV